MVAKTLLKSKVCNEKYYQGNFAMQRNRANFREAQGSL